MKVLLIIVLLLLWPSVAAAPCRFNLSWPQTIMSYETQGERVEYMMWKAGGEVIRYEIGEIKRVIYEKNI